MKLKSSRFKNILRNSILAPLVAACVLVTLPLTSQAWVVRILDIDGTVFNDVTGRDGAWRTEWVLIRIDERANLAEQDPSQPYVYRTVTRGGRAAHQTIPMPSEIYVSYDEYYRHLDLWGRAEGLPNSQVPIRLDFDPLVPEKQRLIVPGYYRISPDHTYRFHRPNENGRSHFVSDYLHAVEREKLSRGALTLDGPAMPILKAAYAKGALPGEVVFSSARGQREEELLEVINLMKKHGRLQLGPQTSRTDATGVRTTVHMLHSPAGRLFGSELFARKTEVIDAEARQLLASPEKKEPVLHPDAYYARQGHKVPMHVMIVPENDIRFIEGIARMLERLSRENRFAQNIKFVLFNAAAEEDLQRASRWKQRWTVFNRGIGRPAVADEIKEWTMTGSRSCGATLNANARGGRR